jgi:hypothetical protein
MSDEKVKPREKTFYVECNPESQVRSDIYKNLDFSELLGWIKKENLKRVQVTFTEIVDWPKTPMRNYFHGATVKAFQAKLNDEASGSPKDGKIPYYSLEKAKEVVMIALFGTTHVLEHVSTEEMSGYEYWDMINAAELLYFNTYGEMYDKKDKPPKPTPFDK